MFYLARSRGTLPGICLDHDPGFGESDQYNEDLLPSDLHNPTADQTNWIMDTHFRNNEIYCAEPQYFWFGHK